MSMTDEYVSRSGIHLAEELGWARRVIEFSAADEVQVDKDTMEAPVFSERSNYSDFIEKHGLTPDERFVFVLGLAPHFRPSFLETFLKKNPHTDDFFTDIGGKKSKGGAGFLPTEATDRKR